MDEPTVPTDVAAPSRPTRLNLERARAMIAAWRASGLDPADFARQRGISVKTFDRWHGRIEASDRMDGVGLARVAVEPAPGPDFAAPRVIPGTPPQVVLPREWDADCLRRVLEACRC